MPLKPAERIAAIRAIAGRLVGEDWPVIDLTLHQFGRPTADIWNGGTEAYIIEQIKDAPDNDLVEMANYLAPDVRREVDLQPAVAPPFWRAGFFKVFISHLAAHRAFAAELQTALLNQGITSFVAHNDIEPTAEWQTQIELGLASSDALVALLHPEFHDSNWTDQEIGYAMGRGIPVFSVRLGVDPYGFIGRFQAFNGHAKTAPQLAAEISAAYRRNKQTAPGIAAATVALFEQSGSFDGAKARMSYVEELPYWTPELRERVRQASVQNDQINGSWGVPARVAALMDKWSVAPA